MELCTLVDDVALLDEVAIKPLHDEAEVVSIGYSDSSVGTGQGIRIGAHSRRLDNRGQLETDVDLFGLVTHCVDQQTNLNSRGLAT